MRRKIALYLEPRDAWIGVYVGPNAIYVCPLPFVVIRWTRRATRTGRLMDNAIRARVKTPDAPLYTSPHGPVETVVQPTPPWPVVGECFERHEPGHSCPQHDGSHEHLFVAWREAPQTTPEGGTSVVAGRSGPGLPVRCRVCGGRKCDMPSCRLIRHHPDDHLPY